MTPQHTELRSFVYLASLPYSGSTLVSFLVNLHPQIGTVGEGLGSRIDTSQDYICSCGQAIKDCRFWQAVDQALQERGFESNMVTNNRTRFDLGNDGIIQRLRTGSLRSNLLEDIRDAVLHFWPGHLAQIKAIAARNEAFASAISQISGKPIFFDASKHHMAVKYLSRYAVNANFRVVHLVRDPRGGVASLLRHHPELSFRQAANLWKTGNLNIERHLGSIPADKKLRIRYEDICTDTEAALNRLCRFCGATDEWEQVHSCPEDNHIIGNYMRLGDAQQIRLDEKWRQTLGVRQLDKIKSMLGDLSNCYGYRLDGPAGTNSASRSHAAELNYESANR